MIFYFQYLKVRSIILLLAHIMMTLLAIASIVHHETTCKVKCEPVYMILGLVGIIFVGLGLGCMAVAFLMGSDVESIYHE